MKFDPGRLAVLIVLEGFPVFYLQLHYDFKKKGTGAGAPSQSQWKLTASARAVRPAAGRFDPRGSKEARARSAQQLKPSRAGARLKVGSRVARVKINERPERRHDSSGKTAPAFPRARLDR